MTPINSPMAKPEEPKLNVTDSIGINLFGSVDKKEEKKPIAKPAPIQQDNLIIPNKLEEEFKPHT